MYLCWFMLFVFIVFDWNVSSIYLIQYLEYQYVLFYFYLNAFWLGHINRPTCQHNSYNNTVHNVYRVYSYTCSIATYIQYPIRRPRSTQQQLTLPSLLLPGIVSNMKNFPQAFFKASNIILQQVISRCCCKSASSFQNKIYYNV